MPFAYSKTEQPTAALYTVQAGRLQTSRIRPIHQIHSTATHFRFAILHVHVAQKKHAIFMITVGKFQKAKRLQLGRIHACNTVIRM